MIINAKITKEIHFAQNNQKIKSNTPQKIKIKNQNLIMCEDNNAGWWINGGVEDRRWLGLSSTPLDLGVTILFGLF